MGSQYPPLSVPLEVLHWSSNGPQNVESEAPGCRWWLGASLPSSSRSLSFLMGHTSLLLAVAVILLGAKAVEALRAMGRLKTRAGTTVMGAAIVDDIMGVTTLIAPIGLRMLLRRSHAAPPSSELAAATAEEALNAAGLPALAEPVR